MATREKGYDCLAYRAEHSLSILDQLSARSVAILESKIFAPNSDLAQPINYILRHLPYFKRTLLNGDIDLSNNAAERAIAKLVLFRQAVHHFKNELGAHFMDIIWRVGFTAIYNDVNPFLYEGRVETLLINRDSQLSANKCRSCQNITIKQDAEACPSCEKKELAKIDLLAEFTRMAELTSADVEFADPPIKELEKKESVAAMLRY